MTRAMERLHLSFARSRAVFGQRKTSQPSRFLAELPEAGLERSGGLFASAQWPASAARGAATPAWVLSAAAAVATPAPGDLDAGEMRPGARVRHPLFGVGTVLRREGDGADLKLTVSFPGVGAKKLVARFAGLELV
jgi:DNA helicase-2/ATP-dependent DNA helicase PcrA